MRLLIISFMLFICGCVYDSPTKSTVSNTVYDTTYKPIVIYKDTIYDTVHITIPLFDTIVDSLNDCYLIDNLGRSYSRFKIDSLSYWMAYNKVLLWNPIKLKCN